MHGRHDRLIGQFAGCAAVMVLQANHGYEVMGWLRRQGMVTINSLHLLDRDLFNVPVGHPYLTLAYEHAFDLVCAPGHKLLAFCAAPACRRKSCSTCGMRRASPWTTRCGAPAAGTGGLAHLVRRRTSSGYSRSAGWTAKRVASAWRP